MSTTGGLTGTLSYHDDQGSQSVSTLALVADPEVDGTGTYVFRADSTSAIKLQGNSFGLGPTFNLSITLEQLI